MCEWKRKETEGGGGWIIFVRDGCVQAKTSVLATAHAPAGPRVLPVPTPFSDPPAFAPSRAIVHDSLTTRHSPLSSDGLVMGKMLAGAGALAGCCGGATRWLFLITL